MKEDGLFPEIAFPLRQRISAVMARAKSGSNRVPMMFEIMRPVAKC
jgi:hypothetical protein